MVEYIFAFLFLFFYILLQIICPKTPHDFRCDKKISVINKINFTLYVLNTEMPICIVGLIIVKRVLIITIVTSYAYRRYAIKVFSNLYIHLYSPETVA